MTLPVVLLLIERGEAQSGLFALNLNSIPYFK